MCFFPFWAQVILRDSHSELKKAVSNSKAASSSMPNAAEQLELQNHAMLLGLRNLLVAHVPQSPLLAAGSLVGAAPAPAAAPQQIASPQASPAAALPNLAVPQASPAPLPLADQTGPDPAMPKNSQPEAGDLYLMCFVFCVFLLTYANATLVCRPAHHPTLLWTSMKMKLTELCCRARPRPKLLPRPSKKQLPSQRPR